MEQYATTAWPAQHRLSSNQNDGKKGGTPTQKVHIRFALEKQRSGFFNK
jgi:hypothetical protein